MRWLAATTVPGLIAVIAGCATVVEPPAQIALPQVKMFSRNAPGDRLPDGWRLWTLSRFKKATEYKLVSTDGRVTVRARAHGSASGLVHALNIDPQRYPLLHWQWKVDNLIASADNTTKQREDSPVRVVVPAP